MRGQMDSVRHTSQYIQISAQQLMRTTLRSIRTPSMIVRTNLSCPPITLLLSDHDIVKRIHIRSIFSISATNRRLWVNLDNVRKRCLDQGQVTLGMAPVGAANLLAQATAMTHSRGSVARA